MTEEEFVARIKPLVPEGRFASPETLRLVTRAIKAFPASAKIWFLHGRVVMAAAESEVAQIAGRSFEMALKINPMMGEAHEALKCFRKVAELTCPLSGPIVPPLFRRLRL